MYLYDVTIGQLQQQCAGSQKKLDSLTKKVTARGGAGAATEAGERAGAGAGATGGSGGAGDEIGSEDGDPLGTPSPATSSKPGFIGRILGVRGSGAGSTPSPGSKQTERKVCELAAEVAALRAELERIGWGLPAEPYPKP
jgi:hypothetical protein